MISAEAGDESLPSPETISRMASTTHPATEEELLEEANAPDVAYEEDGQMTVYCNDQALEVTDKFEDGVCYVQLQIGEKTEYMTIKYQNGYALSPNGYVQPDMFNTGE